MVRVTVDLYIMDYKLQNLSNLNGNCGKDYCFGLISIFRWHFLQLQFHSDSVLLTLHSKMQKKLYSELQLFIN